jgi:hypothetical protein
MDEKSSITFGPGVNAIKFIFFLVTVKINKLECLSLTSLFGIVQKLIVWPQALSCKALPGTSTLAYLPGATVAKKDTYLALHQAPES